MKKIVTIGGGTGHFSTLKALTKIDDISITAIVSVADSGGSSGQLRDEFGVLPPGDILQALLALSRNPQSEILRDFLRARPTAAGGKHNGGNLLLAMMEQYFGSPIKAYEAMGEMLGLNSDDKVFPVTIGNITLRAEMEDGEIMVGETNIDLPQKGKERRKIKKVWLEPNGLAYSGALQAIASADFIIMGPGDLYTSIIPVILTRGIKEAINKTSARKVYIAGTMNKNETHDFKLSDYIFELEKYMNASLDYIIVNTFIPDKEILDKYAKEGKRPVEIDIDFENKNKPGIIKAPLISEASGLARHDSGLLSEVIADIIK